MNFFLYTANHVGKGSTFTLRTSKLRRCNKKESSADFKMCRNGGTHWNTIKIQVFVTKTFASLVNFITTTEPGKAQGFDKKSVAATGDITEYTAHGAEFSFVIHTFAKMGYKCLGYRVTYDLFSIGNILVSAKVKKGCNYCYTR